jgi:hypothetical protein
MQRIQPNRATADVASKMEMSGQAIAYEINRSYRTGRGKSFWRIASSSFLGSLMMAGFFCRLSTLACKRGQRRLTSWT